MGQDQGLEQLSSPELHDLAVDWAKRHGDVRFFHDLLGLLPAAEAGAGELAESADEVFDPGGHRGGEGEPSSSGLDDGPLHGPMAGAGRAVVTHPA